MFVDDYFAGFLFPPLSDIDAYIAEYQQPVLNSSLWSPLADIDTFDIPSSIIDLSPFLPVLWDHGAKLSFQVTNGYNDVRYDANWRLSANVLSYEIPGSKGTGTLLKTDFTRDNSTQGQKSTNGSLIQVVRVARTVSVLSTITVQNNSFLLSWDQDAEAGAIQNMNFDGSRQEVVQALTGTDAMELRLVPKQGPGSGNATKPLAVYKRAYSSPLYLTAKATANLSEYTITSRKVVNVEPVFTMSTVLKKEFRFLANGTSASASQDLFKSLDDLTFERHAMAVNGSLVRDMSSPSASDSLLRQLESSTNGNVMDILDMSKSVE